MTISYRNGMSILELIFYFPALCVTAVLAYRHGINRNSGWIYFGLLSILRIIGAACELDTISNNSSDVFTAAAICSTIGLSPLLLANIGLLSRANDATRNPINPFIFRILGVVTMVGLILCIVGGVNASNSNDPFRVQTLTKVGEIIFTVSWAVAVGLCILIATKHSSMVAGERRLVIAVGISLPFILVRLIYALIAGLGEKTKFSPLIGNVTIFLCMALIEEFIVVIVCLGVGLTLQKAPARAAVPARGTTAGMNQSHKYMNTNQDLEMSAANQNGAPRRQRQAPIHQFIRWGKGAFSNRK